MATSTKVDIRVHPRARRDAVEVGEDGSVRVSVTAAPERGRANDAVEQLLAERLGVARSSVSVVRGRTGRRKVVEVDGMEVAEVMKRLGGGF